MQASLCPPSRLCAACLAACPKFWVTSSAPPPSLCRLVEVSLDILGLEAALTADTALAVMSAGEGACGGEGP